MLLKQKKIIKYFKYLRSQNDEKKPVGLVYQGNNIDRHEFIVFLLSNTDFLKNKGEENEKNTKKRWADINTTIGYCVKNGLFNSYKDKNLVLTVEGEEFIKPLKFFNTVLREYGEIKSAFIAFLLSGVFWAFIFFSSGKIYDLFNLIRENISKYI